MTGEKMTGGGQRVSYSFECLGCGQTETREGWVTWRGKPNGVRATFCKSCSAVRARESAKRRWDRNREKLGIKLAANSFWTPERIAEAKALWAGGKSGTEIGDHFRKTRGAVLGMLGRNGALGKRSKRPRNESRRAKSQREASKRYRAKISLGHKPKARAKFTDPPPVMPALPPLYHSIVEVTGCRYIAGEDHLFCGHPKRENSSYCDHHHRACHAR